MVKLTQNAVEIADDVVAAVGNMAGIHTDTELLLQLDAVDDGTQFFKCSSDFTAFAGHGFEQDGGGLIGRQYTVQHVGNQLDALFRTLLDMTAGMEVVKIAGGILHAAKIVAHRVFAEFKHLGIRRRRIECIRRVC